MVPHQGTADPSVGLKPSVGMTDVRGGLGSGAPQMVPQEGTADRSPGLRPSVGMTGVRGGLALGHPDGAAPGNRRSLGRAKALGRDDRREGWAWLWGTADGAARGNRRSLARAKAIGRDDRREGWACSGAPRWCRTREPQIPRSG